MNEITQHVPGFVDVARSPVTIAFESTDELLGIPFVKRFSDAPDFDMFMVSDGLLMAVYKGYRFYVVGSLKSAVDLPTMTSLSPRRESISPKF